MTTAREPAWAGATLAEVPRLDPEAIALLAPEHAVKARVVPYAFSGKRVLLALADPLDEAGCDEASILMRRPVTPVQAPEEILDALLRKAYGTTAAAMAARLGGGDAPHDDLLANLETVEADDLHRMAEQPSLINLVNLLILEAIRARASDVHVEPFEKKLSVKYRIDGVLVEQNPPPKALQAAITSRIKIMAGMNIAERYVPQDGHIALRFEGRKIDIRVSCVPTIYGESVVMRILDKESISLDLGALGMTPKQRASMQQLIDLPHGMVLVTGPTGSGKTTTLYAALTKLYDPSLKIITIEDPVEYELAGVNQIPVNPKRGLTFADGLRSILRQDPDVIMVGEVRDAETAEISIRAALTGHLVFSTLHTNNAITAAGRLLDMGIEPFLLASVLEGIWAQRLGRRLCDACKQRVKLDDAVAHRLAPSEYASLAGHEWRGQGCEKCSGAGLRGRVGFYEVILSTPGFRRCVTERATVADMQKHVQSEFLSMRQDGISKAAAGLTTVDEVLRATQDADDSIHMKQRESGGEAKA